MARVLKGLPPEFVARNLYPYGHPMHDTFTGSWESRHQLEEEAMELIEKRTTIVRQQVADSYACYEVVQRNPLQLRWIPYCDAWEADPAWLRGLNLSDIERSEQWEAQRSSWESFAKIKELTGRNPLWRMSDVDERLPSNYSSHGEKC